MVCTWTPTVCRTIDNVALYAFRATILCTLGGLGMETYCVVGVHRCGVCFSSSAALMIGRQLFGGRSVDCDRKVVFTAPVVRPYSLKFQFRAGGRLVLEIWVRRLGMQLGARNLLHFLGHGLLCKNYIA